MDPSNQLITIAQAADEFGVNPKTLETWHHRGEITRIGTAPKDRARPGRRAGLYDRGQIEAAVIARTADEQPGFDSAEAVAGNGTSPPSPAAQPAEPLGIRRNSAASAADKLVQVTRRDGRSKAPPPGQHETTHVEGWPADGPGEIREQSRVASHEHPNSARTSTHRTALRTTGVRSAA